MLASTYPTQEQLLTDIVDLSIFAARVIVAGTRDYDDYAAFSAKIFELIPTLPTPFIFYSGMARSGADHLIVRFCQEHPDYLYYPFPADWQKYKKSAGYVRNAQMAIDATHLWAFYDGASRGTGHMIKLMQDKNCPVTVIPVMIAQKATPSRLYTIQMAQWRQAQSLGIKFIDITAKSGLEPFAPDFENVLAYKEGRMNEAEYTRRYLDKMTNSKERHPRYWKALTAYPNMAFACYCPAGQFCHRHLFVELVKDYLEAREIEVILGGELIKDDSISDPKEGE